MELATRNLLKSGLLLGVLSVGLYACGQSESGSGTGGSPGSGGAGSGGKTGSGGTGGTMESGGTKGSGGVQDTGGTVGTGGSNTGGTKATGGNSSATGGSSSGRGGAAGGPGSGGSTVNPATGGVSGGTGGGTGMGNGGAGKVDGGPGRGGTTGRGDAGPVTGSGGTGATGGTTSTGTCQKGQVKPAEVVFMGESFYAIDPQYNEKRVESDAQAAGALAAGAKYRNVASSGQPMSYIAGTEWNSIKSSSVKVIIMDGGGIDCLQGGSCPTCASQFTTLLGQMATAGVQDVIYTRYPEPGAPPGSNTSLKQCLDTVMPTMEPVCEKATGLKCHWVDLRPVFVAGDTTDGLHPTQTGGNHVGDAIWAEMVKDCIAQ